MSLFGVNEWGAQLAHSGGIWVGGVNMAGGWGIYKGVWNRENLGQHRERCSYEPDMAALQHRWTITKQKCGTRLYSRMSLVSVVTAVNQT